MKIGRIILYRITDLFIRSKIEETVKGRIEIEYASNLEEVRNSLSNGLLVICDLMTSMNDLDELVAEAKHVEGSVLGFYPHVETEFRRLAQAKGVDNVVPKSALEATLKKIIAEKN